MTALHWSVLGENMAALHEQSGHKQHMASFFIRAVSAQVID